jgi:hypothetical protein
MQFCLWLNSIVYTKCSLFTAGTMTGFDASGHIAEETKNARLGYSSYPLLHLTILQYLASLLGKEFLAAP